MGIIKKGIRRLLNIPKTNEEIIQEYRGYGMKIGNDVVLLNCGLELGHAFLVEIGNHVTITGATILAHDASTKMFSNYAKVGRVKIGDHVFISNGVIVLPNVTIGSKVIVGAGTIVSKDIPSNSVVAGNPMRLLCTYDEYAARHLAAMEAGPRFENYWPNKTPADKEAMIAALDNGIMGYDL